MEIDCVVLKSDFTSGKVFGKGTFGFDLDDNDVKPMHMSATSLKKKFAIPLKPVSVNSNRQQPQYPGDAGPSQKKGIDLEPVGLLQKSVNTEKRVLNGPPSYWSAHWYVKLFCFRNALKVAHIRIGASHKERNIRPGMEMHT